MKRLWFILIVLLSVISPLKASMIFGVGESDSLAIADSSLLTLPNGEWAISMWVNGSNAGTGVRYLASWGARSQVGSFTIALNRVSTYPGDTFAFGHNNRTEAIFPANFGSSSEWFHIVWQRQSNNALTMHKNGVQITQNSAASTVDFTFAGSCDSSESLYIGNESQSQTEGESWGGYVAEVAKWNSSLTTAQIEALGGLNDYVGDPQAPDSDAVNETPTWYIRGSEDATCQIGGLTITNTGVTFDSESHPVSYDAGPDPASSPSPADGATGTNRAVRLSWTSDPLTLTHDVWFGSDSGNLSQIVDGGTDVWAVVSGLVPGTTYFWRVDEIGSGGTPVTGTVWSFTPAGKIGVREQ